jgi:hypothetical protein
MKKLLVLLVSLCMLSSFAFAENKEASKKVEIKDLPKAVIDAAKEKVKGFEGKEAKVKDEDGGKEYEINGIADGKAVEIEVKVDKDGKVTKVEIEETKKDKKEGDGDGD